MNRQARRAYAKKLGIEMPRGVQHSSEPTHKVEYKKVIRKSRAGVKYTHYKKTLSPIGKSLKEVIFGK